MQSQELMKERKLRREYTERGETGGEAEQNNSIFSTYENRAAEKDNICEIIPGLAEPRRFLFQPA